MCDVLLASAMRWGEVSALRIEDCTVAADERRTCCGTPRSSRRSPMACLYRSSARCSVTRTFALRGTRMATSSTWLSLASTIAVICSSVSRTRRPRRMWRTCLCCAYFRRYSSLIRKIDLGRFGGGVKVGWRSAHRPSSDFRRPARSNRDARSCRASRSVALDVLALLLHPATLTAAASKASPRLKSMIESFHDGCVSFGRYYKHGDRPTRLVGGHELGAAPRCGDNCGPGGAALNGGKQRQVALVEWLRSREGSPPPGSGSPAGRFSLRIFKTIGHIEIPALSATH